MFATTSATRMFLQKAAVQGAKMTAARAFGTQAASMVSAFSSPSALVRRNLLQDEKERCGDNKDGNALCFVVEKLTSVEISFFV